MSGDPLPVTAAGEFAPTVGIPGADHLGMLELHETARCVVGELSVEAALGAPDGGFVVGAWRFGV